MKRTPTLETYRDDAGQYRWRLRAANGQVMAQGESHSTRSNAWLAGRAVIRAAAAAVVVNT